MAAAADRRRDRRARARRCARSGRLLRLARCRSRSWPTLVDRPGWCAPTRRWRTSSRSSETRDWMNGIQFYLDEDVPHRAAATDLHRLAVGADLGLAGTVLARRRPEPLRRRQRSAASSRSTSPTGTRPGLNGKTAARVHPRGDPGRGLGPAQAQPERATAPTCSRTRTCVHWYLDPRRRSAAQGRNAEPLLVNLVDTWRLRPQAVTAHPEPVPGRRLRADLHRSRHHGGAPTRRPGARSTAILRALGLRRAAVPALGPARAGAPGAWRAHDRQRYRQGLPWDDTVAKLALSALAALQPGPARCETSILRRSARRCTSRTCCPTQDGREPVATARTPDRRAGSPSAELLRAFAALTRTAASSESIAASALETLTSAARTRRVPTDRAGRVASASSSSPSVASRPRSTADVEQQLAQYRDLTYRALLAAAPDP